MADTSDSEKVRYYDSDMKNDYIKNKENKTKIDGNYKYIHSNLLWNLFSFLAYRIIATPIAYLYMKLKFDFKVENKEVLKKSKKEGYFLYINHTQMIGDAFSPTLINFPKKTYVVVNKDNINLPFWGNIIKLLGPLPIPDDIEAGKNFLKAIKKIIEKKGVIVIYPEAHLWDYYTQIRDFGSSSFKYPIETKAKAFSVTVTYKKRKKKVPQIVAYIDGPFISDKNLNIKEKREDLRNKVFDEMTKRAKNNNVEYIKYLPKMDN